jgi:hypothetical protein
VKPCAKEPRLYWSIDRRAWITADDVCTTYKRHKIRVPAGFETDLASVPGIFHPLINTYGNYNRAAIIHDYLYMHKGVLCNGRKLSRLDADKIFLQVMLEDKVSWLQAHTMFRAVRIYPGNYWPFKSW